MNRINDINNAHCEACNGLVDRIEKLQIDEWMALINEGWQLDSSGSTISRSFKMKNFAKVMFLVNAVAHMADREGHHPDVSFGYNTLTIAYTTHEAKGLTRNDFICAKKVDGLI